MFQALRRLHIAASDFPRSRRFYGETLGLPEASSFENDWVEFALGPIILKLTPLRPGEVPARNQVAPILSTNQLDRTLQVLKERGVTVTRAPADEFTGRSAEILDPDGYRLILFQPSDLHPDEEWVPMSRVDELVRHRLNARRAKLKAKGKKPARKPKKPARKPSRKPPKKTARKRPKARTARKKARVRKAPAKKKTAKRPGKKSRKTVRRR